MSKFTMYKNIESRRLGMLLFVICFVMYAFAVSGRLNYSAALASMTQEGIVDKVQGGTIATVFYLLYAVGQLFSGWLGTKISPLLQIVLGLGGEAVCNLAMGFADGYAQMVVIWGLNGLLASLLWPPTMVVISNVLPHRMKNFACIGIALTGPVGILLAYFVSSLVLRVSGYRYIFILLGSALALIFAVTAAAFAMIAPRLEHIPIPEKKPGMKRPAGSPAIFPLLVASGLFIFIIPAAIHGMLKDGVITWVPTMIREMYGASPALSSFVTMVLPIINLSGAGLATLLLGKMKNELNTSAVFFASGTLFIALLTVARGLPIIITVVLLALITTSMYAVTYLLLTVVPVDFSVHGCVAFITGLLNFAASVGCSASNFLFGLLSENLGWTVTITVWCALAVIGLALCLVSAKRWGRFKGKYGI